MSRRFLWPVVLLLGALLFGRAPFVSGASVLVVDDDGRATVTTCDAAAPAYSTISAALSAASPGDTVLVCPGTYVEQLNISTDGLTVRSVDGSAVDGTPNTIIRPTELVQAAVRITGNRVTFQGFRIEDVTVGHPHAHRLIFVQGDDTRVLNNLLRGRETTYNDVGILVRGGRVGNGIAEKNLIQNNDVSDIHGTPGNGILTVSVSSSDAAAQTMIRGNTVREIEGNGIAVDRVPGARVEGNTVEASEVGLYFRSTSALPAAGSVFRCPVQQRCGEYGGRD